MKERLGGCSGADSVRHAEIRARCQGDAICEAYGFSGPEIAEAAISLEPTSLEPWAIAGLTMQHALNLTALIGTVKNNNETVQRQNIEFKRRRQSEVSARKKGRELLADALALNAAARNYASTHGCDERVAAERLRESLNAFASIDPFPWPWTDMEPIRYRRTQGRQEGVALVIYDLQRFGVPVPMTIDAESDSDGQCPTTRYIWKLLELAERRRLTGNQVKAALRFGVKPDNLPG